MTGRRPAGRPIGIILFWLSLGTFSAGVTAVHQGSVWWPQAIAITLAVTVVGSLVTFRQRS